MNMRQDKTVASFLILLLIAGKVYVNYWKLRMERRLSRSMIFAVPMMSLDLIFVERCFITAIF